MSPKPIYKIPRAYKNRSLAHVLTSLTFTELKEIASSLAKDSPRQMDMDFYKTISNSVRTKYKELSTTIMRLYAKDTPTNDGEYALLDKIQELTEGKEFPNPEKIFNDYRGDIVDFLLGGRFKDACESGLFLTPEYLVVLSYDVYNRYFALISRERI